MEKQWCFKAAVNQSVSQLLAEELQIPAKIATILVQRGIENFEEAKSFFRPGINQLHSPFLMKDMEPATKRVVEAIQKNQNILVYGDYDVDGTTSVSMMYSFLKEHSEDVTYYIPDRYREGYGVSQLGVDLAVENKVDLFITLDCGIKAVDVINSGVDRGVDFIVCDHHTPGHELPKALVLDPKRKDCEYPFKELSGCGVGFKLIQGVLEELKEDSSLAFEYIDLLAISIAADIVPIIDENRVLAQLGLEKINSNPSFGIRSMIKLHRNYGKMTIMDIVFGIAPKINAAGRISSALNAVELLLSQTEEKAKELIEFINKENTERKELDKDISWEAEQQIIQNNDQHKPATIVFKADWHKGVIGIVASRLIEKFYRPTIVLTKSGDYWSGSARSVHGYSVYGAIDACSEHLIQFGGHKYAAGLTILEENIIPFKKSFEKYVASTISEDQKSPKIEIDSELDFMDLKKEPEDLFPKFYRLIKSLAPFGPANMRPTFLSRNVEVVDARVVGDDHLKLTLKQDKCYLRFGAIAFGQADKLNDVKNLPFHIVFNIEENTWNKRTTLQFNIKDIKFGQLAL